MSKKALEYQKVKISDSKESFKEFIKGLELSKEKRPYISDNSKPSEVLLKENKLYKPKEPLNRPYKTLGQSNNLNNNRLWKFIRLKVLVRHKLIVKDLELFKAFLTFEKTIIVSNPLTDKRLKLAYL